MLINLLVFLFLVTAVCGGIWFLVKKNVISDTHLRRFPSGGTGMPAKNEQSGGKSQTMQSAADVPANAPIADPGGDRQAWQDRRISERWRDWLALTTVIMAIMTVIMALEASRATMLAVHLSGRETNQWMQFQAKGVKEYSYQITKAALELQLSANADIPAEAREKYRQAMKRYDEEIKRYKDEKDEIMQDALAIGKAKEKNIKRSSGFNSALVFLLIGILLSAIATLVRRKYIWYIGLSMLAGWGYFLIISF
jgi:flagellar basal body-associated protein FliL